MNNVISLCEYRRRRRPTFTDQERISAVIKAVTDEGVQVGADPLVIDEAVHAATTAKHQGESSVRAIKRGKEVLRKRARRAEA